MKTVSIGAALVAATLAVPAGANPDEKRRDVRVAISDLDLGTSEGVAALDRRLERAVVKACGTAYYLEPEQLVAMDRCRADARSRAMAARKTILARGSGGAGIAVGAYK